MALETWPLVFSITPYYGNDLAPLHLMSIKCPALRDPRHGANFTRTDISPVYGYKRANCTGLIGRRGRGSGALGRTSELRDPSAFRCGVPLFLAQGHATGRWPDGDKITELGPFGVD